MKMFGSPSGKFGVFCIELICHFMAIHARVKTNTEVDCERIKSQPYYSLSDMAGEWFGIELLEHVTKDRITANSCIRVEIKELDSNNVELIWREKNYFQVIYRFVILDSKLRGVWTTLGPQTVTNDRVGYAQFAGNVFVLQASEANIVLTFCSQPHVLYSLVLSKTYTMNETELASIHNMVHRFGAPIPVDVKKYCRNHAAAWESVTLLLVLCIVGVFIITLRGR